MPSRTSRKATNNQKQKSNKSKTINKGQHNKRIEESKDVMFKYMEA